MFLRFSAALAKKLGCKTGALDSAHLAFPNVWYFDVFKPDGGERLVLASEENTLFSVLIPLGRSKNHESFLITFAERLKLVFADAAAWQKPDFSEQVFSGRTNRGIIGSQNDLIHLARVHLALLEHLPLVEALADVEGDLNSAPMSVLKTKSPERAFLAELERRQLSE